MDTKHYKINLKAIRADLFLYVSADDIDLAIEKAIDTPYNEWEVSDFVMPEGNQVDAEEVSERIR
jgi:L-rhamnose mutarotase